jgi:hypothetical protein
MPRIGVHIVDRVDFDVAEDEAFGGDFARVLGELEGIPL